MRIFFNLTLAIKNGLYDVRSYEASAVSETELEVDQVGSGLEFSIMVTLCPSTIVSDCSPARHNQSTTIGSPTKPSRRNRRQKQARGTLSQYGTANVKRPAKLGRRKALVGPLELGYAVSRNPCSTVGRRGRIGIV